MIETTTESADADTQSPDVPTTGEDPQTKSPTSPGSSSSSHKYSITAKSLMEDDDEEDDDEEQGLISRNPSLVDYDEDHRDHNSDESARKGPSHLERNTNAEEKDSAMSEICAPSSAMPLCQGGLPLLPGCQGQTLAEQIDFMTQCRHPLEIFSVFHEHVNRQDVVDHKLLPGMYAIPRACEYCGAVDSDYCTDDCQRPKSFFQKKRPPFCPPNMSQWDPVTDVATISLEKKSPRSPSKNNEEAQLLQEGRGPSFLGLGDLFRKPGGSVGE